MIPTTFDSQGYPMAVPVGSADVNIIGGSQHVPHRSSKHVGGLINRLHSGGVVGSFPRMHGGGSLGAGIRGGGAQVHVYPVMDRRAIIKDMASRQGQKLIFDVVKGRRIDLGV